MSFPRFLLHFFVWLVVSLFVWSLLTPAYNRFLTAGVEQLVRLTEGRAATRLHPKDTHYFVITRTDYRRNQGGLYSVRVTDTHFPLILLGALFLAVPGVDLRTRLTHLGIALAVSLLFHLLSLWLWVKFAYATQLGAWSLENYGPVSRNLYGLGKHLADLPFKFALPLLLWCAFYLDRLLPAREDGEGKRARRRRRSAPSTR